MKNLLSVTGKKYNFQNENCFFKVFLMILIYYYDVQEYNTLRQYCLKTREEEIN